MLPMRYQVRSNKGNIYAQFVLKHDAEMFCEMYIQFGASLTIEAI